MLPPVELIELGRFVGDPTQDLCIEAEGNVSASTATGQVWIKGSGKAMRYIAADDFACCSADQIVATVDQNDPLPESEVRALLNSSKVDRGTAMPSTETYMHAWLLSQGQNRFVAHAHPTVLLSMLCHPEAAQWADKRLFPDEIVLLGPATCFVPYVAPGLPLARAIRDATTEFRARLGIEPKTYWLQNHGLIVTGSKVREVCSGLAMAVKASRVLLGCLQTGREPKWLTKDEIDQICNWPDEHARQRALWGTDSP